MTLTILRIDGPKCPDCGHRELDYTMQPVYGWGYSDGCRDCVRRDCPECGWGEEGGWT